MRGSSSQPKFIAILAALFFFTSCGLGTEIGNGFKPGKDEEGTASGAGKKQSAAPNKEEPVNGQMPEAGDGGGSDGATDDTVEGGGTDDPDMSIPALDTIDTAPLFAGCATPFAGGYAKAMLLSVVSGASRTPFLDVKPADAQKLSVDVFKAGQQAALRRVEPRADANAPWSATIFAGSNPQAETLTCKDLRDETTNLDGVTGDVTKTSVVMIGIGNSAAPEKTVTWYVLPKSDTANAKLLKIEMSTQGRAPLVIEVTTLP